MAACLLGSVAHAASENPLEPPDRSSPRATIQTFVAAVNEAVRLYDGGDRDGARERVGFAARCLDLSKTPPAVAETVAFETALRLKEILDRIPVPSIRAVPDADAMEDIDPQQWVVPNTEITIARVAEGPREGLYLFSHDTVARSEEFYRRVRDLPYKPGKNRGAHYETYARGSADFLTEWVAGLPDWAKISVYGQTVWQWVGLVLMLCLGAGGVALCKVASTRAFAALDRRRGSHLGDYIGPYVLPLVLMATSYTIERAGVELHITGGIQSALGITMSAIFLASGVWLVTAGMNQIATVVISAARFRPRSVDSQLVRLGFRVLIFAVAAGLLINAASQLGLPAYSILTSLGIGGLAVALAARDTLANLFGSIMIMFDRPFRVGDWIKVGTDEGTVEDVGFRSTRIRTFYNSVLSVPSSHMVNASIDNMGRRRFRRVKTVIQITYDTPAERIEAFVAGIKEIIRNHEHTRKDYFHVVFHDFGAHSLDILLYFFLRTPDWSRELIERENILLQIVRLAESMDVRFAFPTRTLHVESMPDSTD